MRMIERWFPCEEVSLRSARGWGSGASEKSLFTWFAARPLAQARAAVLCSLLPWPEDDEAEQERLKALVLRALEDRDSATAEVRAEIERHYPDGASALDLFSGRGIIPLEIARTGATSYGIDYSPVATLAGQLLAHYPARDWSDEPPLPFGAQPLVEDKMRLARDVEATLVEVGRRWKAAMAPFYPKHNGKYPWGYGWAVTLPCQSCGRRFPLIGRLELLHPNKKRGLNGQSYRILADSANGTWSVDVHEGAPKGVPTRVVAQGKSKFDSSGRLAVCPFCGHPHEGDVQRRLMAQGLGEDALLVASDIEASGKVFREPTDEEREAAKSASVALRDEPPFPNGLPAVPNELIPPQNTWTIQALVYGAKTWGDLCTDRQTLGFVRLCRAINEVTVELNNAGLSRDYVAALCGYAAATVIKKMKRSTRGATLGILKGGNAYVEHVFGNTESSISYSQDFFECGLGRGPGSWESITSDTVKAVKTQCESKLVGGATIGRASALLLPFADYSLSAVVCDPPYDAMIEYADASDLFFVWLKRAMATVQPEISLTLDARGNQEKTEEIIVKKGGGVAAGDHRTREHYDRLISQAFHQAQRVTQRNGVVTIIFGHGDPDVWNRLLGAISEAGLVLTGSWPAKTEPGGQEGSANIRTTLTLACRPALPNRPVGKARQVELQIEAEVEERARDWERQHLVLPDQLMASAGPAMEVVGRYERIENVLGEEVSPVRFLALARRAVQKFADIRIEDLPLETFDARTRFALFWAKAYGRTPAPKSEARWQALAADSKLEDVLDGKRGVLAEPSKGKDKGVRLIYAAEFERPITPESATIDVALAMARAWSEGLDAVSEVLAGAGRERSDNYLWATLFYLAGRLPDGDPDKAAWTSLSRARNTLNANLARKVSATDARSQQLSMFDSPAK